MSPIRGGGSLPPAKKSWSFQTKCKRYSAWPEKPFLLIQFFCIFTPYLSTASIEICIKNGEKYRKKSTFLFLSLIFNQGRFILYVVNIQLQGNSEKCTGSFKFGCRVIFWSIYLSKSGLIRLNIYRIHTKNIHIILKFYKKYKYMSIYNVIFSSNFYKYHFECT